MRYEVESAVPPDRIEFDPLEDGEPPQTVAFPVSAGTDARFFRAFAFKPTREGVFTVAIRAYAGSTLIASASCPGVTVVP